MTDFIPAHIRSGIYAVYATLGIVLGAVQVGFAAADAGQPVALTVALAVYAFLGGALGFTARANTPEVDVPGGPVTPDEVHLLHDVRRIEGRDGAHDRWDDEPGSDDLRGERG